MGQNDRKVDIAGLKAVLGDTCTDIIVHSSALYEPLLWPKAPPWAGDISV